VNDCREKNGHILELFYNPSQYGAPVVLRVEASRMHAQNFIFYCSVNGVWLTERVPREFIEFPPEE